MMANLMPEWTGPFHQNLAVIRASGRSHGGNPFEKKFVWLYRRATGKAMEQPEVAVRGAGPGSLLRIVKHRSRNGLPCEHGFADRRLARP